MDNLLKKHLPPQSEFDHRFACWAVNHNGWAKMKKVNRRLAKRKMKREIGKEMRAEQAGKGVQDE